MKTKELIAELLMLIEEHALIVDALLRSLNTAEWAIETKTQRGGSN